MALLTNLRVSLLNDVEVHYEELQIASDNSRVESVLALCHLYQRLSQAGPIPHAISQTPSRVIEYTSPPSNSPPESRTPRVVTDLSRFPSAGVTSPVSRNSVPSSKRSLFQNLRRNSQRQQASSDPTAGVSGQPPTRPPPLDIRPSNTGRRRSPPREFYSPDEVNPWTVSETEEDRDASALGPRIDPEVHDPDGWGGMLSARGSDQSASSHRRTPSSILSSHSGHSSVEVSPFVPPVTPMRLYLPSEENNYAGFCKGAWKQQLGLKKAFVISMRPAGLYNDVPYWRCSKCMYEGPVRGHESRKTWKFDGQVRTDATTGIRYRWVFLAKSHVPAKRLECATDGSSGPFGCIFCCAMHHGPAPVLGNLASFMEHLVQQHREIRSGFEALLERTRCVVGRVAAISEDFDLNIP